MKKTITILLVLLLSTFISFHRLPPVVSAQVDLNFGEQAVEAEIPGTENAASEDAGFAYWIGQILNVVLVAAVLIVFANYLIASIEWVSSGGDSGKIQKARDRFVGSTVGLLVLAASVAIFMLLQNFLGIEILTFATP